MSKVKVCENLETLVNEYCDLLKENKNLQNKRVVNKK